jgi:hypothetical protein
MFPAGNPYCSCKPPGVIELDPTEPVIIVNFLKVTVDLSQNGEDGKPLVVESQADAKRLRVGKFHANSDAAKFAAAVAKQTNLIHESKIPLIEDLLEQLRTRLIEQGGGAGAEDNLSATAPVGRMLEKANSQPGASHSAGTPHNEGGVDVRSSMPSMPSSKQKLQPREQQREFEDEGDGERRPAPASAASTRPGSAARQRAPLDTQVSGLTSPQPSSSPKGSNEDNWNSNGNGAPPSKLRNSGQNPALQHAQAAAQHNLRATSIQDRIPLTPEEEEALERERIQRREREERQQREQRKLRNAKRAEGALQLAFKADQARQEENTRRASAQKKKDKENKKKQEKADLSRLDEYMETLYEEDMQQKIRGTGLILKLVQNPAHLDHFIDNDTVLGALVRQEKNATC